MIKIYQHPISQPCQEVLATAAHLGLEVETVTVDLSAGQQQQPEYLKKNPAGAVPLLEHDGFLLRESNAIVRYLNELAKGDLVPQGQAAYLADQWLHWESCHLTPATQVYAYERLVKPQFMKQEADEARIESNAPKFHKHVKILEEQLAQSDYIIGDKLSVVDFAIASSLGYAEATQMPLENYPKVQAWRARMNEVPAWKKHGPAALAK